jgi:PleD family two-component response regulator
MSRILLVDDDTDLAELVQTKLTSEGHSVEVRHSGEGAFEAAKQIKPELVILDIMLPGVTGYQICRRLRKDPELYKVGILILTALGEEPEMQHGLEQGADDYLAKPFRLDTLMEKIGALQALQESVSRKNALTNLPSTDAIKREINHRLARGVAIAACYLGMVDFKAYCAVYGKDGQEKALKFMATTLVKVTRERGIYECFIAHLGGEHFVVMLNLDDYESYCRALVEMFDRDVKSLYSDKEMRQGYVEAMDKSGKQSRYPLMTLSIGVAHTQFRSYKSAKKMFEVLAQTRQKARPDGKSKVFVDRRKTER